MKGECKLKRLVTKTWTCRMCGKKINSSIRECSCGFVRDSKTEWDKDSPSKIVDPKLAEQINRNEDWYCSYCDSSVSDDDTICPCCGHTRSDEDRTYSQIKAKREENDSAKYIDPIQTIANRSQDDNDYSSDNTFSSTPTSVNRSKHSIGIRASLFNHWKAILASTLGIAFLVLFIFLLIPRTEELKITSFSWDRALAIEKYKQVSESDWNLPENAELQYTKNEIYTYQQVLDHYEKKSKKIEKRKVIGYEDVVISTKDLGNGYFEEEVSQKPIYETYFEESFYEEPIYTNIPVYKTKYYYTIYRWKYDHTLNTAGFDQLPYWADTTNLPTDERISARSENYFVHGKKQDGEIKKLKLKYSSWTTLQMDQTVKFKVYIDGSAEIIN